VVEAQANSAPARDELIAVLFNWSQAQVDLAKALDRYRHSQCSEMVGKK
jgi:outer membrane protein TolC